MVNADFNRAYDYIRQRILSREYRPGDPLMPDFLGKKIGVSRTPIRDALRQLSADGLVTIRARAGASVREISADEYEEICGLRMALEIFAAGRAARLRSTADLLEMSAANEAIRTETEKLIAEAGFESNPRVAVNDAMAREDVRFHLAIASAARNRAIKAELLRHQLVSRIVVVSHYFDEQRPAPKNREQAIALCRSTWHEHDRIYAAIKSGDPAAAKEAMEFHLQEHADTVLQRMNRVEHRQIATELAGIDWEDLPAPAARPKRPRPGSEFAALSKKRKSR